MQYELTKTNKQPIPCPLCSSKEYKILYRPWNPIEDPKKIYGAAASIPGTQQIVTCNHCDFIYENPRFSEKTILEGYEESLESGHDSQFPMRVHSFYKALLSLSQFLPPKGSKILDIGTAGGAFLDAAQKYGFEAYGLEPSEYLSSQGIKRGLQIKRGTIENNPFPQSSFDMITLWDVLEHMTEPKKALMEIKKWLKPGGILLINYPDIGTIQAKLAGKHFWWIISGHLVHFTKKTAVKICELSGFEVFHQQKYWQTLEFGYLEQRAIHYQFPLSRLLYQLTPNKIRKMPVPYYASQTTLLAKIKK